MNPRPITTPSADLPPPDFAADLNAQQLEAVAAAPGPALVIAGAGSGKTRTLTYRVAWLLSQGARPWSILLLTFTNKAAKEMLERVGGLAPQATEGIWGGTFHSIGNRILRRHAEEAGFRPNFSIMDRADQEDLIESVVARAGLRGAEQKFPKAGVLAELFSLGINTGQDLPGIIAARYRYFTPLMDPILKVQIAYEGSKREANVMDFDDLLSKALELFQTCPEVLERYQRQFEHVLVDEYQDTNRVQAALVDMLGARTGNIMVVGDDAQSIYSWRGATCENILEFPRRHEGCRVFKIETNYRSVPEVLQLANAAIVSNERQFHKELRPVRPQSRVRPALAVLPTNNDQARFVADEVLRLHEDGMALREIAVLYRAHFHSMEVQLEFTRRGIPFQVTSGLRFFEQAHVKDVAAFLKFAVNPRDEVAFKRMVRLLPGVGAKSAERLWRDVGAALGGEPRFEKLQTIDRIPRKAAAAWKQLAHTLEELVPAGKSAPPRQMIASVLYAVYEDYMKTRFANYENRLDDLNTLANYAETFESTEDFLAQLALLGQVETLDDLGGEDRGDAVVLSSVHQAKGLEWRAVFLIWLADGMFPNARSVDKPESLEEERRLFYVGVTRCKDELFLTYPEFRLNAGYSDNVQRPSRFLNELPQELVRHAGVAPAPGSGAADEPW